MFVLLTGKAAQASPSIDEVTENLGVGKNITWEFDPSRTDKCSSLGGISDDCSCNESLVFEPQGKVNQTLSCGDKKNKTVTTQTWKMETEEDTDNNLMWIDDKPYVIEFNNDSNLMSLSYIPGQREKKKLNKVYKRH